jgi:hypothetical protein
MSLKTKMMGAAFVAAVCAASPALASLVNITFTPSDAAIADLHYSAVSFQAPQTVTVGTVFGFTNIGPSNDGQWNAGYIDKIENPFALAGGGGPWEFEAYFGNREDIHVSVTPGPSSLFSLNADETVATFNFGTFSNLAFPYNGAPVSGTVVVSGDTGGGFSPGVPELPTWAMMLTGVALLGLASRRGPRTAGAIQFSTLRFADRSGG